MTPSPEQPEHEEARRLAEPLLDNPDLWSVHGAIHELLALLSKAEQTATQLKAERDTEAHLVITQRLRADLAERELEKLRIALAQVDIPGLPPFVRRIVRDALSADTQQREP